MTSVRARAFPALAASVAALALVSALVVRTSQAAFTDTTANESNSFTAGEVQLTDDDSGASMFSVTGMKPGETVTACITVTYTGTVSDPSAVKLYGGGFTNVPGPTAGSAGLGTYLRLTVEEGTGGSFGNCAGFNPAATILAGMTLATFNATHTAYGSGVGGWTPAGSPVSRTYRIAALLDPDTPNVEQAAGVSGASFVWEVQS